MSRFTNQMAGPGNFWLNIGDEIRLDNIIIGQTWDYHGRGPDLGMSPGKDVAYWPKSSLNGDPASPASPLGHGFADGGPLSAWGRMPAVSLGKNRPWFFRGTVKNESGVPIGGAVVTAFLAGTEIVVGEVQTDDRGVYECPTPYVGVNHFLVARYASGSLGGTTVDTLQPSL